jgi:hypothetical protein
MKSQRSGPLVVVVDRLVERSTLLRSIYKYPPSSVSEPLAQMIVYAWTDTNFRNQLLNNVAFSKQALADRGVYLKAPVVITEDQYNNNYVQQDPDGVIFVLPNPPRTVAPPQGQSLLETAKLLMACTPNGI